MKSLGKHEVLVEVFIGAVLHRSFKEKRVVYKKSDNTFWVNWYTGGKRQISLKEPNLFYQKIVIGRISVRKF